jgi:rod shape-determining protein MreC
METFLSRYRNISVLLLLLVAQVLLLAFQVKTGQDVRLIRVWAVAGMTPAAKAVEWVRQGPGGWLSQYFVLRDAEQDNRRLKDELGKLRLENYFLKNELAMADRAKALIVFQGTIQSKTLPTRVLGSGTDINARTVFVDRGSQDGVKKGMAVVTPEGIAGKVVAAYPKAALVMLVTSQGFAAGVISQKNHVRGTMRGIGSSLCPVDHVENRDKVEVGEWFYTSGDDRIFPKGLPAGVARSVRDEGGRKDVVVEPTGLRNGIDELLIVTEGVHGVIPDASQPASAEVQILPPPPPEPGAQEPVKETVGGPKTDADRLLERYKRIGEAQGHVFGGNPYRPPDFNKPPSAGKAEPQEGAAAPAAPGAGTPATGTAPASAPKTPPPPTPAKPNPPGARP